MKIDNFNIFAKNVAFLAIGWLFLAGGCGRDESHPPAPKSAQELEVDNLQSEIDSAVKTVVVTNYVTVTNVVAAGGRSEAVDRTQDATKPQKKSVQPEEPSIYDLDGDLDEFGVNFSCHPDLTTLLDYVKVTPNPGPLTQDYSSWSKRCRFRGEFQPRTKYTVVFRAGLPMANGRKLAKEFRRTFTTSDRPPQFEFAAKGRYLPSAGRRAVSVKTTNITNLVFGVRSVPTKNIVQLLARENDVYANYYGGGGDSSNTQELSGDVFERTIKVKNRLNESISTQLPLNNGKVDNGVYLVSVRSGDRPLEFVRDYHWKWRLVCVTDIGLSIREINDSFYVWTTSLTNGRPLAGLQVQVYGPNGMVQSEGVTDAEGWCCCECTKNAKSLAVVVRAPDGSDTTFVAVREGAVEDPKPTHNRRSLLKSSESEAFVWTDRGIYRHEEPIMVQAIVRNGKGVAPKPFPVDLRLIDPNGNVRVSHTKMFDRFGAVAVTDFTAKDWMPSGMWEIQVCTPGKDGYVLGSREFKVEEFVPPQIRVKVMPPKADSRASTNLLFTVSGEHMFGGPAKGLPAEGAYMFEDAPFAPRGWEGFRFGDENRRLQPNFTTTKRARLDADGRAAFVASFSSKLRPRAAVKLTVQGCVFEGGGRPAAARASTIVHAYPYYIGVALPETLRHGTSPRICRVVMVNPDGTPCRGTRRLVANFEQIDTVYELQKQGASWEWRSEKIRHPFGEETTVEIGANGLGTLAVPVNVGGDFALTLREESSGVSFGASYWVGGNDDDTVRAPLENPSRVSLSCDKQLYYPGERPKITVKAPFTGTAWLTVMRDELVYSQVLALDQATTEILLEPVKDAWAPGVDVALSVVQAVRPGERQTANRALGYLPLRCTTRDLALDVALRTKVVCAPEGGSKVTVDLDARKFDAVGEMAVVTVVDEAINLLTDEKTPDPAGWFGEPRDITSWFYDVYNQLLPILDSPLKRSGVKTGGGADEDLFRRVSPIPSRRYKPLSLWRMEVPLKNGQAQVTMDLPEFVGEVRVTAVAYNHRATGAGSVQAKVTPKLVMQPDAPRFAAPGDRFLATMTLTNRSGNDGTVTYDLLVGGSAELEAPVHGEIKLTKDASETLTIPVTATKTPGQSSLIFVTEGFDEKHRSEIELPVRPAVPWVKSAQTVCLKAGEKRVFSNPASTLPETAQRLFVVSGSPVAELASALEYLVGYPHGCLEQTTSRVFPLLAAGGILNTLPVAETSAASDSKQVIATGVRRICSMMRNTDFVMWPDSDTSPWDSNVSLWASHFLVVASKNGYEIPQDRLDSYLRRWAASTNATVSVYACHNLALAGKPDRDRQLAWYDKRTTLTSLDCSRLARAFARSGDLPRAKTIMESVLSEPSDLCSASFELLARLDVNPQDVRIGMLVAWLFKHRGTTDCHWGTTESNAHALLALGSYYRANVPSIGIPQVYMSEGEGGEERKLSPKRAERITGGGDVTLVNRGNGDSFVCASCLSLPNADKLASEAKGISVSRRFLRSDGSTASLDSFVRGEMLLVEITLSAPSKTTYSDLVVEDLLPACFEPDQTPLAKETYPFLDSNRHYWLLRHEFRDDRVQGFSKRFTLDAGASVKFVYPVRVVGAGEFTLPGTSVEAMYDPSLHARGVSGKVKVEK